MTRSLLVLLKSKVIVILLLSYLKFFVYFSRLIIQHSAQSLYCLQASLFPVFFHIFRNHVSTLIYFMLSFSLKVFTETLQVIFMYSKSVCRDYISIFIYSLSVFIYSISFSCTLEVFVGIFYLYFQLSVFPVISVSGTAFSAFKNSAKVFQYTPCSQLY